jgi:hypothetical protein
MLKLFNRFGPASVGLLYVLNWLLKLKYVVYPVIAIEAFNNSEVGLFTFPSLASWAVANPKLYTIISIHCIFLFALLANHIWRIEKLISKNSILPALSIIVISSLLPSGFLFSINYFIFILLLGVLMLIFGSHQQAGANARLFRAGALMGCIMMIKPIFILLAITMVLLIAIFKSIDGKSIIAYLLGTIIPVYLFISVVWILSPALLKKLHPFSVQLPEQKLNVETLLLSLVSIIWFMVHAYFIKQNKSEMGGIYVQKKWLGLRIVTTIAFVCGVFSSTLPSYSMFIFINLSALMLFQCFNMVLNKKWANFTFVFLILVILINEYVLL